MEPESSLPHLQAFVSYPYPEPDQSSPCTHIPLHEGPSFYYPSYTWGYGLLRNKSFPKFI